MLMFNWLSYFIWSVWSHLILVCYHSSAMSSVRNIVLLKTYSFFPLIQLVSHKPWLWIKNSEWSIYVWIGRARLPSECGRRTPSQNWSLHLGSVRDLSQAYAVHEALLWIRHINGEATVDILLFMRRTGEKHYKRKPNHCSHIKTLIV
jgi:hypothetical protein